jgi:hypothetical protein
VYRDAAEVAGVALDFTRMDTSANPQTILLGVPTDRCRTPHGSCRSVEEGKEAVTRRVDFHATEPVQLDPHSLVVRGQQLFPGRISQPDGHLRGVDDVGDEQGRDEALARLGRSLAMSSGYGDQVRHPALALLCDHCPAVRSYGSVCESRLGFQHSGTVGERERFT